MTSCSTSLLGAPTASALRHWFEREFATENTSILETARFSYGLAFVDDLHYCAQHYDVQDLRRLEDRPEALLKGLMDGSPLTMIRRNVSVRSAVTLGIHPGSRDGSFKPEQAPPPRLHISRRSDPRLLHSLPLGDDFVMQRMGLVGAASGETKRLLRSPCFAQILPHMCVLGLPSMNATELHVSLMTGAVVSMAAGLRVTTTTATNSNGVSIASESGNGKGHGGDNILDVLGSEIAELSRITMAMCSKMISPLTDSSLTCAMERAIRSVVVLDVSLVSRFCLSLRYGVHNVTNPGALLQLFAHEWKRYFLDPLPSGPQRVRIVDLLREQLQGIDEKTWAISRDWLSVLQEDFAAHKDRVWTDARLFEAITTKQTAAPSSSTERTSAVEASPSADELERPDSRGSAGSGDGLSSPRTPPKTPPPLSRGNSRRTKMSMTKRSASGRLREEGTGEWGDPASPRPITPGTPVRSSGKSMGAGAAGSREEEQEEVDHIAAAAAGCCCCDCTHRSSLLPASGA